MCQWNKSLHLLLRRQASREALRIEIYNFENIVLKEKAFADGNKGSGPSPTAVGVDA